MNVPCKIPDIVKAYESIAISIFIEPKVLQDHQIKSLLVDISEPLRKMITLVPELKDEYYLEKEQKERLR